MAVQEVSTLTGYENDPNGYAAYVAQKANEHIPQEEYDQLVEPYCEAMTRLEVRMKGLNEDYRKKYQKKRPLDEKIATWRPSLVRK